MDETQPTPELPVTSAPPHTFGEKLKAARLALSLSQTKVADLAGVSAPTIISWEYGRSSPHPAKQRNLLKKLVDLVVPIAGTPVVESGPEELAAYFNKQAEIANPPKKPTGKLAWPANVGVPGVTNIDPIEMEPAPSSTPQFDALRRLAETVEKANETLDDQQSQFSVAAAIYASQEPQEPMMLTDPPATVTVTVPAAAPVSVVRSVPDKPRFGLPV